MINPVVGEYFTAEEIEKVLFKRYQYEGKIWTSLSYLEQEAEKDKGDWLDIGNGLEINTKQQFDGKTYAECCELAKQNNWEIADYPLLQKLRNEIGTYGWGDKLNFLKDFWVFFPNPVKIERDNVNVVRFDAISDRSYLFCLWYPTYSNPSLGVFVLRKKLRGRK